MIKRIVVLLGSMVLALAPVVPASAQTYSNAVQALGPAAYWPLNETTAPSAAGEYIATNLGSLGAAGNGYYETWWTNDATGVLTNMNSIGHVAGAIAGDSDTALQQGGVAQYVVIPRTTNGVINSGVTLSPPFSIEFWFYPTNGASGKLKPILCEGFNNVQETNNNYKVTQNGTALGLYSSNLYFVTFNADGHKTEIDDNNLPLNKWYHAVATFDGTTESLYVNGALIGSKTPPLDALGQTYAVDTVSPLIVGGGNELGLSGGANVFFGGALDEVAIYNSTLSLTQVTNHFETGTNAAAPTPYTQVVSADAPSIYLRLDEPAFTGGLSATNNPIAANVGSLGAAANGYYLPGTSPGSAGPTFGGFTSPSYAVACNGFNGAVDVGGGALPSALNPTNGQPMTIMTWFKGNPADCVGRFQVIVGHTDSSWRMTLDTAAGPRYNPGNGVELQFTNLQDQLGHGLYVNDGDWHFLAGVNDGTNESLYVDGMLVKTGTPAGIVTNGSPKDVILGGDAQYLAPAANGGGRWFDGSLAQVAFFTNALTTAQIQNLYNVAGVPLSIFVQPHDTTNNAGTTATLSISVHGSTPSYQWYSTNINSGVVTLLANQTNSSLVFNPVSTNQAGFYFAIATNSQNAVTSSVAQLTVVGPPAILSQSTTNMHVFVGTTPTIHLTPQGANLVFQWLSNNVAIPNATNANYTLTTSDTSSAASSVYTCIITNSFGPITDSIPVTVLADPTAAYPVQVLADHPMNYFRLDEADTGYPNNGVVAYDYAGGENGSYSNTALGQMTYSPATDPGETSAGFGTGASLDSYMGNVPAYLDLSVTNGGNAEFSVELWANGSFTPNTDAGLVTIGYGFGGEQFCIDCGGNETTHPLRFYLNSANGSTYKINTTFALSDNPGWHHIVAVCDEAGGHIYLYIDGLQVGSTTIPAGAGLKAETSPLAIGSRLSTGTATDYDNQFYGNIDDVAIYNYALSATQVQSHYFGAGIAPVITQVAPTSLTTNQNSTVNFTVTVSGTAPLTYQWLNPSSQVIPNATNATLTLSNVQPSQTGIYTVNVNNSYGTATTNVSLTVNQGPPLITTDVTPTNLTAYAGTPETYSIIVAGSPPFSYQWYQNGTAIPNATNSSYSFNVLLGTNTYYCSVTNSASAGTPTLSSTATVVGKASTTLNPASYTDHIKITFSGYNRSETLQDFPVLVKLSTSIPGFNYSHFASGTGGDLRFTDSGGTRVLPSEIETWNPNGESIVWVQLPALSSTNDYIWAYWGNPSDTTAPAGTNVWVPQSWEGLPSYAAVYHLKENGFPYVDSTSQYTATNGAATVQTNALIGLGQAFGGGSYIDAGTVNLSNAFTVSAWVNLNSTDTSIQCVWANKVGGYSSFGFGLYVNSWNSNPGDGTVELETGDGSSGAAVASGKGALPAGGWHLLSAVINPSASQAQLYVDASVVASGPINGGLATNNDMRLGAFDDNVFAFNGMMDEARVRLGTNSVNWIWASYMTVAQNSSLESYGAVSTTVTAPADIQFQRSGSNLIVTGSFGQQNANAQYRVLSTTNVTLPMAQWTPVLTNTFDGSGNLSNGVPLNSTVPGQFFRVVSP